jgi:hypothetical protein
VDKDGHDKQERKQIRVASNNIGRQGNLESALRALDKMNIDIGILQETKITDDKYKKKSFGIIATKAISAFQGGIAIAYRTSAWWSIESIRLYHPNVISFTLVTGKRRYSCLEAYIPPGDTIDTVYEAIERSARNTPILLGDLNADSMRPRDDRAIEVAAMTATFGLEDLVRSFRQRISFRGNITWSIQRGARRVSSRCDYILCSDRRLFRNVAIRRPQHYTTARFMIIAILMSKPLQAHRSYTRARRAFPLHPSKWGPKSKEDALFEELKGFIARYPAQVRKWNTWILTDTWRLVDRTGALRQSISERENNRLQRLIHRSIQADRKERTERVGQEIEELLSQGKVQVAWHTLKAWYKDASGRAAHPSRQDLHQLKTEYGDLLANKPTQGDPIPVLVAPFRVDE